MVGRLYAPDPLSVSRVKLVCCRWHNLRAHHSRWLASVTLPVMLPWSSCRGWFKTQTVNAPKTAKKAEKAHLSCKMSHILAPFCYLPTLLLPHPRSSYFKADYDTPTPFQLECSVSSHSQLVDFAHYDFVRTAAIESCVDRFLQKLSRCSEFPMISRSLHLVDFAILHVSGAARVGAEEVLIAPARCRWPTAATFKYCVLIRRRY